MKHATLDDLKDIEAAFHAYKDIFPFIRRDFLQREIAAGRVLYDYGIVGIIKQLKRPQRYGTWRAERGWWNMSEIVRTPEATSPGAYIFLRKLLQEHIGDSVLFGTVRDDNTRSIQWHTLMGYKRVGDIVWKNGTLPGGVWMLDNRHHTALF